MSYSLINLLLSGLKEINLAHSKEELKKVGYLRGGSSGLYQDGKFYGTCPRKALLRFMGIGETPAFVDSLKFQQGKNHEDFVNELLKSNPNVKKVIPEFNIQYNYGEINWSGRIDFLVEMQDSTKFIIETKSLTSSNRVKKIKDSDFPFITALLQCSIYKLRTGFEASILYGCYFISYNGREKLEPFLKEYKVDFKNGFICVNGILTELKVEGLDAYYEKIIYSIKNKLLPGRVTVKELGTLKSYDPCKYCTLSDTCNDFDKGLLEYDTFIQESRIKFKEGE